MLHKQTRLQDNRSAHVEHHDSRALRIDGRPERSGASIIEMRHFNHATAATTFGQFPKSLRARKRFPFLGDRMEARADDEQDEQKGDSKAAHWRG